jgi:hypothetical protein
MPHNMGGTNREGRSGGRQPGIMHPGFRKNKKGFIGISGECFYRKGFVQYRRA